MKTDFAYTGLTKNIHQPVISIAFPIIHSLILIFEAPDVRLGSIPFCALQINKDGRNWHSHTLGDGERVEVVIVIIDAGEQGILYAGVEAGIAMVEEIGETMFGVRQVFYTHDAVGQGIVERTRVLAACKVGNSDFILPGTEQNGVFCTEV